MASNTLQRAELQEELREATSNLRSCQASLAKAEPILEKIRAMVAKEEAAFRGIEDTFQDVASRDVIDMHLWEHCHDLLVSARDVLDELHVRLATGVTQVASKRQDLAHWQERVETLKKELASWGEVVVLFKGKELA